MPVSHIHSTGLLSFILCSPRGPKWRSCSFSSGPQPSNILKRRLTTLSNDTLVNTSLQDPALPKSARQRKASGTQMPPWPCSPCQWCCTRQIQKMEVQTLFLGFIGYLPGLFWGLAEECTQLAKCCQVSDDRIHFEKNIDTEAIQWVLGCPIDASERCVQILLHLLIAYVGHLVAHARSGVLVSIPFDKWFCLPITLLGVGEEGWRRIRNFFVGVPLSLSLLRPLGRVGSWRL